MIGRLLQEPGYVNKDSHKEHGDSGKGYRGPQSALYVVAVQLTPV